MQQTKTYKLNKIEMGDVFSTAPLNENADKVEAQLARVDSSAAALAQRVVTLEGCRIVMGQYVGDGVAGRNIDLGERPAGALICPPSVTATSLAVGDIVLNANQSPMEFQLTDSGFQVGKTVNNNNTKYSFLAFLGGWGKKDFPQNAS